MNTGTISLVVFFEGPFWVGICERREDGHLQAAKITFGAEPKDADVWEHVREHWFELDFSAHIEGRGQLKEAARNPKRRQREAARAVASCGVSTKSQLALSRAREQKKQERQAAKKERRELLEAEKYAKRQQKRREKHRGH